MRRAPFHWDRAAAPRATPAPPQWLLTSSEPDPPTRPWLPLGVRALSSPPQDVARASCARRAVTVHRYWSAGPRPRSRDVLPRLRGSSWRPVVHILRACELYRDGRRRHDTW